MNGEPAFVPTEPIYPIYDATSAERGDSLPAFHVICNLSDTTTKNSFHKQLNPHPTSPHRLLTLVENAESRSVCAGDFNVDFEFTVTPSMGRGEDGERAQESQTPPQRRYWTRSSKEQPRQETGRQNDARGYVLPSDHARMNHVRPLNCKQPPFEASNEPHDEEMQDSDAPLVDSMSDFTTYATSNPVRAPFPSPALKSTQPFFSFPSASQGTQVPHTDGGWGGQDPPWQNAAGGKCILVEAANRAQMAILVDDMGSMGIEQMEQT